MTQRAAKSTQPAALRLPDAATYIGCGRSKIYELVKHGRIPTVRYDGCVVILVADLDAFMAAARVRASA